MIKDMIALENLIDSLVEKLKSKHRLTEDNTKLIHNEFKKFFEETIDSWDNDDLKTITVESIMFDDVYTFGHDMAFYWEVVEGAIATKYFNFEKFGEDLLKYGYGGFDGEFEFAPNNYEPFYMKLNDGSCIAINVIWNC